MPAWPATLPQLGIVGANYRRQDAVARSQMDAGPSSRRSRFTAVPKNVNYRMIITGAQLDTLESFYETTLRNGALEFDWFSPVDGSAIQIAFREPPDCNARVGNSNTDNRWWVVSLSLEIQP